MDEEKEEEECERESRVAPLAWYSREVSLRAGEREREEKEDRREEERSGATHGSGVSATRHTSICPSSQQYNPQ